MIELSTTGRRLVEEFLPGITRWFLHTSGLHVSRPVGRPARISVNGKVL